MCRPAMRDDGIVGAAPRGRPKCGDDGRVGAGGCHRHDRLNADRLADGHRPWRYRNDGPPGNQGAMNRWGHHAPGNQQNED